MRSSIKLLVLCILALAGCTEQSMWPVQEFTAEVWKATPEDKRYVFAKDILNRKVFVGYSRKEVATTLGEASATSPDGSVVQYLIKTGSRVEFSKVYALHLTFDSFDRVRNVVIAKD
jgi:hypothetical protein